MSNSQIGASHYDDRHRAFLQAILARQNITFDEAKPMLAAIQTAAEPDRPTLPGDVSQSDLQDYVYAVNARVSPFDMEIRSSVHQITGEKVYALVNTTSDALTQMATIHSADEIAFVKRVLDAMFDTNNTIRAEIMAVSAIQAVKCAKPANEMNRRESSNAQNAAAGGLTMSQAEKVLDNLVQEGWFELSAKGFYSLTPRSLMELRGWLMDTYNETAADAEDYDDNNEEDYQKIKCCQACKEIITVGQRCPQLKCSARLHNRCLHNMFRAQGGERKCPICQADWAGASPVGELAAKNNTRRSNGGNMNGRREEPHVGDAGSD